MKFGHHYYVYIVECKDGSYYTGITNDYERSYGNTIQVLMKNVTRLKEDL